MLKRKITEMIYTGTNLFGDSSAYSKKEKLSIPSSSAYSQFWHKMIKDIKIWILFFAIQDTKTFCHDRSMILPCFKEYSKLRLVSKEWKNLCGDSLRYFNTLYLSKLKNFWSFDFDVLPSFGNIENLNLAYISNDTLHSVQIILNNPSLVNWRSKIRNLRLNWISKEPSFYEDENMRSVLQLFPNLTQLTILIIQDYEPNVVCGGINFGSIIQKDLFKDLQYLNLMIRKTTSNCQIYINFPSIESLKRIEFSSDNLTTIIISDYSYNESRKNNLSSLSIISSGKLNFKGFFPISTLYLTPFDRSMGKSLFHISTKNFDPNCLFLFGPGQEIHFDSKKFQNIKFTNPDKCKIMYHDNL